jgi:hypothetical protein
MFALLAASAILFARQAGPPVVVPPNASLTLTASTSPGPVVGAAYDDEGDTYAYRWTYADGSYIILTGPTPQLTLNRRGGNVHVGYVDNVAQLGFSGFSLTDSQQEPFKVVYTCDSLPDRDGWGAGPITITITGP